MYVRAGRPAFAQPYVGMLFYGELRDERKREKPKDRVKDVIKNCLREISDDLEDGKSISLEKSDLLWL